MVRPASRFRLLVAIVLAPLLGCNGDGSGIATETVERSVLGRVQAGSEAAELYVAYGADAAVLGLAISSGGGAARYFPLYASTHRGIPPVELDVYVAKSGDEMWVRSSWADNETLAYHRIGTDTAITIFGETAPRKDPLPPYLSGGPAPFPEMILDQVEKKASFRHQ